MNTYKGRQIKNKPNKQKRAGNKFHIKVSFCHDWLFKRKV